MEQPNHATFELLSTRLRLRDDLVFTPQALGGDAFFLVEDPLSSRFYRLGRAEYTFASLLDGATTIQEAISRLSTVMPEHQLSESDAAGLCRWLADNNLAHVAGTGREPAAVGPPAPPADRVWNPLVFRLPLFQPDRLFAVLAVWLGWIYAPVAAFAWFLLLTAGAYRVFSQWDRFVASSRGIFAPDNWLWLAGCWMVLKILHESSHGIVCRRYGASVRETGVLFILFAPLAYVDVTSSWRLRSRWQRVHIAAAGMYVELLIAAAAALVWSNSDPGWLNHAAFSVVVMASITTLVFNANPLMRFDGYYILSDALGIPNLYVSGQQYMRYLARRHLLGLPVELPRWPRGSGTITRIYGLGSFAWRIVICASLMLAAATLFRGAGIVLAIVAAALWIGRPLLRFGTYLRFGKPGEQPKRLRILGIVSGAATAGTLVLGFVPWPGVRQAPAVVEFAPHTVVRARSAGFVREIRVDNGQQVQRGQVIAVQENRDLSRELADLELRVRQSEIRSRRHEQRRELAACQAENKNRESLLIEFSEKRTQVERLVIRAPRGGTVVRRDLAALLGTHLEIGDEIVTIGNEHEKELRLSIAQDDMESFRASLGKPLHVNMPRLAVWRSQLERITPRATKQTPHPGLTAVNGGPLAVTATKQESPTDPAGLHELLRPRFTGIVRLTDPQSRMVRVGQCGVVRCRPCNESIGRNIYGRVFRWIHDRFQAAA